MNRHIATFSLAVLFFSGAFAQRASLFEVAGTSTYESEGEHFGVDYIYQDFGKDQRLSFWIGVSSDEGETWTNYCKFSDAILLPVDKYNSESSWFYEDVSTLNPDDYGFNGPRELDENCNQYKLKPNVTVHKEFYYRLCEAHLPSLQDVAVHTTVVICMDEKADENLPQKRSVSIRYFDMQQIAKNEPYDESLFGMLNGGYTVGVGSNEPLEYLVPAEKISKNK